MLAERKRLLVPLSLVTAIVLLAACPGLASEPRSNRELVRKGVFAGIWHTDPVHIIIEKVNRDGSFTGEIHFDPKGRWGDVRAGVVIHGSRSSWPGFFRVEDAAQLRGL